MSDDLLGTIRREIDDRLSELRPAVAEYQRLLEAAGDGASRDGRERPATRAVRGGSPRRKGTRGRAGSPARRRGPRSAGEVAVIAALEHGSHTVSELVVVTALSAANVRESLRRLTRSGAVTKAVRDGRPAYALSATSG
ncbi:MAG TPA: hypothetical protein VGN08_07770 [Solirubrobacteraceae bacterium]|jgi:DNA-binding transcriptional ArsR family regulator